MDIGEIIAISISIAALLLSVFRVAVRVDSSSGGNIAMLFAISNGQRSGRMKG